LRFLTVGVGGFGGSSRLTSAERNTGDRCAYRIVIFIEKRVAPVADLISAA